MNDYQFFILGVFCTLLVFVLVFLLNRLFDFVFGSVHKLKLPSPKKRWKGKKRRV